ncbi:MAG: peptide deformylase [Bacillota bacterium]
MAIREIHESTDEVLRKIAKPVKEINQKIITLLDDMEETMREFNGVGLAAPQVGILKRIAIIDVGEGLIELINPEIIEKRGSVIDYEGCLSIPGESALVDRPTYVKAEATDRNGDRYTIEGVDLLAVALCHEIEHLDGILYIDHAISEEDVELIEIDDEEVYVYVDRE